MYWDWTLWINSCLSASNAGRPYFQFLPRADIFLRYCFSSYMWIKYIKSVWLAYAITYIYFDFHFTFSVTLAVGTTSLSSPRIVIIHSHRWVQINAHSGPTIVASSVAFSWHKDVFLLWFSFYKYCNAIPLCNLVLHSFLIGGKERDGHTALHLLSFSYLGTEHWNLSDLT